MKTLVVEYLPRGELSQTRKLSNAFVEAAAGQEIERLDLTKDVPDLLSPDHVGAYIQRHYMGQALSPAQTSTLAKMDRMTAQFKAADIVVLAFPMHNFSLPGTVKAYFDSIMLKGETWDIGESGYVGLMKGKKALVLMSSGGVYEGDFAAWDFATPLARQEFAFMGFEDVRAVVAGGMNSMPDKADETLARAISEIRGIVGDWYA